MNIKLTTNKPLRYLAIAGDIITVTPVIIFMGKTGANAYCSPYSRYFIFFILLTGATFLFPYMNSYFKNKARVFEVLSYIGVVGSLFLIPILMPKGNCNQITDISLANTKSPVAIDTTKSTTNTNVNGRDNNVVVQGGTNNKGHVIIGDNNKVGVNGDVIINPKPPQRKINSSDIKLLQDSLPDKEARINIKCIANSKEDELFRNEIWDNLTKAGYKNTSIGDVPQSFNYFGKGRMTFRKEVNQSKIQYNVIVNPQQ